MSEEKAASIAIIFICVVVGLIATLVFIDARDDNITERQCVAQLKDIHANEGYEPDCRF